MNVYAKLTGYELAMVKQHAQEDRDRQVLRAVDEEYRRREGERRPAERLKPDWEKVRKR